MVQLEQVNDGDVDELLRAEGFLQDQPLHTQTQQQPRHTDGLAQICTSRCVKRRLVVPETAPPVSLSGRPACPDSYSGRRDRET